VLYAHAHVAVELSVLAIIKVVIQDFFFTS
jgi:hypothetical protein